jgi:hypothetical protein
VPSAGRVQDPHHRRHAGTPARAPRDPHRQAGPNIGEATAKAVQRAAGGNAELAYVDQDYTGEEAEDDADDHGTRCTS